MLRTASLVLVLIPSAALAQTPQIAMARLGAHLDTANVSISRCLTVDVDSDGSVDLAFFGRADELHIGSTTGRFIEAPGAIPPIASGSTSAALTGVIAADIDGDLDVDFVRSSFLQPLELLINDGSGMLSSNPLVGLTNPGFTDIVVHDALDLEGDGDVDLLVAFTDLLLAPAGEWRVVLNDGVGNLVLGPALPPQPDLEVGFAQFIDANGDPHPDVLAIHSPANPFNSPELRLYLNTGTGMFTDATAAAFGSATTNARRFLSGDLDGDGDEDVLLLNQVGDERMLLNSGTGIFTDGGALPDSSFSFGVLTDFDGDGDLDAVLRSNSTASSRPFAVFSNDGSAGFSLEPATRFPRVTMLPNTIVAADLDADGDNDLVLGARLADYSTVYLNDGTGTYRDGAERPLPNGVGSRGWPHEIFDADGDGDGDLLVLRGVERGSPQPPGLWINDGTGRLDRAPAGTVPARDAQGYAIAVADYNGDGRPDWMSGGQRTIDLYLATANGNFVDASSQLPVLGVNQQTLDVEAADFDGDNDIDLAVSGQYGIRILRNDGSANFVDAGAGGLPSASIGEFAVADFNGDSLPDLAYTTDAGNALRLNTASGDFVTAAIPIGQPYTATSVEAGDVDGDGDADLVITRINTRVQLLLNDGTATFSDASGRFPLWFRSRQTKLVDIDTDGDLDIFGAYGSASYLFVNQGAGTFVDVATTRLDRIELDDSRGLAIGDLDMDGDPDFAVNLFNGPTAILTNRHLHLATPLLARDGSFFEVEVTASPGYAQGAMTALPIFDFALAPSPVQTPFGTVHLDLARAIALTPIQIPAGGGTAGLGFGFPVSPSSFGVSLAFQAFVLDFQNPAASRLTNYTCDVYGG